jgi:xylulokinase
MALMGLDVGSTGCKAMVFSDDGNPISYAYREYETCGSVYETNGNIIWENVKEVLAQCAFGIKKEIKALSISSFGESFVAVDRAGSVLMNTMLYTNPHGTRQCEKYKSQFGEQRIMEIAGAKPHPMYSLPKMGYVHDEHNDIFNKTHKFLLIESFIIFRLTGEFYIDYSLAARTMAFDVTKKKWSRELLSLAGMDEEKLPTAVPCGTAVAKILPVIANELSLPLNLIVVTGGHDQVCAATGAGITKPGLAIDGTGTVECITPAFDKPILTKQFLDNNYACVPHSIDGMYVTYAFNFTGGSILKWYRDNFAKYETILAKEKGVSVYQLLDELGAKNPTDLIVVPHFAGSATPDMNENARGAFMGLRFDTDAPTLYRALIEGVTYEMAYNMEFLKTAGINIHELRAVGGGAKSSYWLSIKANITGCRIIPLDVEEAGLTGTAILAGVASGVYKSIDEAIPYFIRPKIVIEPDNEQRKIYLENYQRYKEARKLISKLYKED